MEDKHKTGIQAEYTRPKIFGRLTLSFTQTVLDYIYAIVASFEVEAIRGVLIMFLAFYPLINFLTWTGILGYLDLKYHNGVFNSIRDLFSQNWKRNLKTALVFSLFQIFNMLPFYIYIKIYKDHHAIFTEELVNLLEQDKQNRRNLIDEEKSFATYKTIRTVENHNNPNNNNVNTNNNILTTNPNNNNFNNHLTINLNNTIMHQAPPSTFNPADRGQHNKNNSDLTPLAQPYPTKSISMPGNSSVGSSHSRIAQKYRIPTTISNTSTFHQNALLQTLGAQSSEEFLNRRESRSRDPVNNNHSRGSGFRLSQYTPGNNPMILITDPDSNNPLHPLQPYQSQNPNLSTISMFKKRIGAIQEVTSVAKMGLKTQIAIEANSKFSLFTIVEESNFQMLFEAGEIMEMAFKSFPMFAIQLCNNILQNNWALYWFTILYFCILIIRLFVVGIIFVKFLLLNDRMMKFLENIRYFNEEMKYEKNKSNQSYPMPETLEITQLKTLKRIVDISDQSAQNVRELSIQLTSQPKNADLIIKNLNASIQKFQNLTKVQLNLMHNKFGSTRIAEVVEFLIQSLIKCTEVSLFFEGNDLNEEDLDMVKSKFDRNITYEKFYFQSEQMVIIFDSSRKDILLELQAFYKRMCIDDDDYTPGDQEHQSVHHIKHGSLRSMTNINPNLSAVENQTNDRPSFSSLGLKMRQFHVIAPNHQLTPDEEKIIMRILLDVPINYLEMEVNFEDSQILPKLQSHVDNMKFNMGFIQSKTFVFFKNGKFSKVQTSKTPLFELVLPIEQNKLDVKPLSIIGAKGLGKALRKYNRLFDFQIIIPDNLISNHGLIHIADALPNHCKQLKIDLQNNMLGDLGSITLAHKLSQMSHLQQFNLSLKENKFLSASSIDLISESISKMLRLKELVIDFSGMDLNSKSLNKFFIRIQNSKSIETLSINLKDNKMDPLVQLVVDMNKAFGTSEKYQLSEKGSYNFSKALESFTKTKVLSLNISSNNIDASGASLIMRSMGVLVELTNLHLNLSDNYIKKNGIIMMAMNLKKLVNLDTMELILDQVKKPNTNQRRIRKHFRGDQRMALEKMMKSEQKPLKAIFKKVEKFNKSLKELKKYVYETITENEEKTLQKYIQLNSKDKDVAMMVHNPTEKLSKEVIHKFLVDLMESNTRTYQMTSRKMSSFEDLFLKMHCLHNLSILKLSLRQNGLVNLDIDMIGQSLTELKNLSVLSLNLSENVIQDQGVVHLFDCLSVSTCLLDIAIDLSSNVIKVEGAEHIQRTITKLCDRVNNAIKEYDEIVEAQEEARLKREKERKAKKERAFKIQNGEMLGEFDDGKDVSFSSSGSSRESSPIHKSIPPLIPPPKLRSFDLNIRNNKIEYVGGYALVEMACKLRDEFVGVSVLMGNCGIVVATKENKANASDVAENDEADLQRKKDLENRYGVFFMMKREMGSSFEYE